MNSAPAELLQLLTIAALQPSSSIDPNDGSVGTGTLLNSIGMRRQRKEKAAMPELDQAVRLVFFAKLTCILIESASHFFDRFAPRGHAKNRNVHTLTNSIT
jgi:acyl-[acyl carrier protein]--UDP-N-acetylglucosamine O-acyltransferase